MGYVGLKPSCIGDEGRFDSFSNGMTIAGKLKGKLPAMGWNSWNAFGSGNTEALTKIMADKIVELGLNKYGYQFVVLDDGCYKAERVNERLANEEIKFPGGFKALSDYVHSKELKFGMYNDIGTNLCAGAMVGTCGFENIDAASYIDWDVDFLKVDNCYYPFDNATFSNPENAKYVFTPNIRALKIGNRKFSAVYDGIIKGDIGRLVDDHVSFIGSYDGTGPEQSPVVPFSSELIFEFESDNEGEIELFVEYATGHTEGVGSWLQVAIDNRVYYDSFVKETEDEASYCWSEPIKVFVKKGANKIRLMNHRRQENTLDSYAKLLKELKKIAPNKDIYYSACEWGKTNPNNWAYKVCDSWRILNDITFRVGSDGDPGHGDWISDYTTSITTQYNKCVIMDECAGLNKGWNDPDMLMLGMDGLNSVQNRTHMAMWCMMNSPLMLGIDLRRVKKGDEIYNIITNRKLIGINQDELGIQAKRVFSSLSQNDPSMEYIKDINRVDILAKPMTNDRIAVSFINVSLEDKMDKYSVSIYDIEAAFAKAGHSFINICDRYLVIDVYDLEDNKICNGEVCVSGLKACDNKTYILEPYE